MDWGAFFTFTLLISLLVFLTQRAEAKRRFAVALMMLIPGILLRNLAVYREVEREAWFALVAALFLNFMFWALIGRYNPVPNSDEMRVLGMDD